MDGFVDIKGYEGIYLISIEGEIFSNYKNRLIKGFIDADGYVYVNLCKDSRCTKKSIHRILAETFLIKPEGKTQVNHKDGCRANNYIDNLEWVTPSENIIHKFANGYSIPKGKENKLSKKVSQFSKAGEFIKVWDSSMDIQRELGFRNSAISRNILNKRPTAFGFIWRRTY